MPEDPTSPPAVTVLLADDDPDLLKALAFALRAAGGLAVTEAADGARALEALDRGPFDVLVLDVLMPGATGWEILAGAVERLSEGAPRPRTIMMTGFHQEYVVDLKALRREGVSTMLLKPFPATDLLEEIARALAAPPPRVSPKRAEKSSS